MSAVAVRVDARLPERGIDVGLEVPAGSVLGLIGPNGVGKSTILQVISGLLIPASGSVVLGDRVRGERVLTDVPPASSPGRTVFVPPHRRSVAQLLQDPALFPTKSALDNVAFPLRAHGRGRRSAHDEARRLLDEYGAAPLAARLPHEMSGGQRARVAIARTVAADPDVVLLDEPLSAVDVESVGEVRQTLANGIAGHTAIIVTHRADDLHALCDLVAVMESGRVVDIAPVAEVAAHPRSPFVERLFG